METWVIVLLIIGVLGIIFVCWLVSIYNRLVVLKNQFENAFSQIEVQLKRRHDLIPNLVELVKGAMEHERGTLNDVISARTRAVSGLQTAAANPGDPAAIQELGAAESLLGGALGRLFALSENYPALQANQNVMQVQEELTTTENKVGFSRQAYNDAVTSYNTYKQTFPPVLVAGSFGHAKDASLLDFDDEEINEAPKISF